MRVLVTRPEPAATRTAARLIAAGHDVVIAPLLLPRAVAWTVPPVLPPAIVLTSAAAARLGGAGLAAFHDRPAYCVGEATAAAARAAGFADVRTAGGTAAALFEHIAALGLPRVLHLAGAERIASAAPAGFEIDIVTVYRTALAAALPAAALDASDVALLYSARTAHHFATLCDAGGFDRERLAVAAISAAALAAAGTGWRAASVAPEPNETALLAAAGLVCDNNGIARRPGEG